MTLSWLASSPEKVLSNWCVPRFWNMILGTGEEQEALLRWILPLCAGSLPIPLMRSYPYPEQHQHTESGNPCMSLPVRGSMYAQARLGGAVWRWRCLLVAATTYHNNATSWLDVATSWLRIVLREQWGNAYQRDWLFLAERFSAG